MSTHRLSESYALRINKVTYVSIPSNVQDDLADHKWKVTMNKEMEALQKNSTRELVPMLAGNKTMGCC